MAHVVDESPQREASPTERVTTQPPTLAGVVVENNHLSLPNGLMDAGRATSTLSKFMTEHGAMPEEVTQAQSGLAKGLGTGAL